MKTNGEEDSRHIFRGELALVIAVMINSLAVILMLYSGSGISAISSVPYAFEKVFPVITLGTWTYIFQALLILSLMILRKKFVPAYLCSFLVGFAFSELLDVNEAWINILPKTIPLRVLYFVISYLLICIGIALSNRCGLPIIPTDLFPRELSEIIKVKYSKIKVSSKSALGSYEKEDFKEINHGNLITLADFYGVSVDYLLCRTENREQINTPLTELHLNDEMVALLKSGRINNRLLCELATHKDFIKFLADIEIYVDGIATMQIQNLNALVDTVRHEIIERYRPGEDDPHLKVLQAAHISDDEYFSHMVLDDLNLIIRDIRETHKKDSESAPQTTVADELKENLEAVENFKGSRDEKLVVLYCKQLGINYKNLSDEEFRWLIRILKKSKKMGTPISQRKKR